MIKPRIMVWIWLAIACAAVGYAPIAFFSGDSKNVMPLVVIGVVACLAALVSWVRRDAKATLRLGPKTWGVIAVAILVQALAVVAEFVAINSSGSLVEARRFAASSPEIRTRIGNFVEGRPEVFKCSLSVGETRGEAHLAIILRGSERSGELLVSLSKVDGVWGVDSARLDGTPIPVHRGPATGAKGYTYTR